MDHYFLDIQYNLTVVINNNIDKFARFGPSFDAVLSLFYYSHLFLLLTNFSRFACNHDQILTTILEEHSQNSKHRSNLFFSIKRQAHFKNEVSQK